MAQLQNLSLCAEMWNVPVDLPALEVINRSLLLFANLDILNLADFRLQIACLVPLANVFRGLVDIPVREIRVGGFLEFSVESIRLRILPRQVYLLNVDVLGTLHAIICKHGHFFSGLALNMARDLAAVLLTGARR